MISFHTRLYLFEFARRKERNDRYDGEGSMSLVTLSILCSTHHSAIVTRHATHNTRLVPRDAKRLYQVASQISRFLNAMGLSAAAKKKSRKRVGARLAHACRSRWLCRQRNMRTTVAMSANGSHANCASVASVYDGGACVVWMELSEVSKRSCAEVWKPHIRLKTGAHCCAYGYVSGP